MNIMNTLFKYSGLICIALGLISFVVSLIVGTTIDANGIVQEPGFIFVPVGLLFIYAGIFFNNRLLARQMDKKNDQKTFFQLEGFFGFLEHFFYSINLRFPCLFITSTLPLFHPFTIWN
ncbi:DUF3955 domain-containing protein [Listeria fleischmannii]|uniref:DUF3955 domain-containing protein n=1 Tax=Listeria fleischmannii TaxID=1069827 RepID=UPI00098D31DF